MRLIFEKSQQDRKMIDFNISVPEYKLDDRYKREKDANLPEVSEVSFIRHYMELSRRSYGVDNGFYPLGSCTMKYNPKLNEKLANLEGFTNIHPLQPEKTTQGCLRVMYELSSALCEITGMDKFSLQPAAGAHGEFTALLMIKAYHNKNKDYKRTKVIVPNSAHGTNPASAVMAGFEIINIDSDKDGNVDINSLKSAIGDDTAALMLTNPNTLGLFEMNILQIAQLVHDVGGLLYYDGANLNPIMGKIRPGDVGYDIVHLNLHKTFSTPHGGGGPGSGPIGCKSELIEFLPTPLVEKEGNKYILKENKKNSIGKVKNFYGNFLVHIKALAYIKTLGAKGIKKAAELSVLNSNYLRVRLSEDFDIPYKRACMHEFVISAANIKNDTGVSALDIAKGLIEHKIHPPTMYFPLIVSEALMFEPTETETKQTLDKTVSVMKKIKQLAYETPDYVKGYPYNTYIKRPDEVLAARKPVLIYQKEE